MRKIIVLLGIVFFSCKMLIAQEISSEKLLDFYQSQKFLEAAIYIKQVCGSDIKDMHVKQQLAYCAYMSGNLPVAEQLYLEIKKQGNPNPSILSSLARIAYKRGNHLEAKAYYEEILERDTTNFQIYKQLAGLTYTQEDIPLKLKYLIKANTLSPTDSDVAYDLAEYYTLNLNYAAAYSVLQIAIHADSSNFLLLDALMPVCMNLKKYEEAAAIGEQLLFNVGASNLLLSNLGKTYFNLKNYEKSLKTFQMIGENDSESVYYYITLCYKQLNKLPDAINSAKRTIEKAISPNVSNYYALLGSLQESDSQFVNAVGSYKKGLFFEKSNNINYNLALVYDLKLNNKVQAKIYYTKYLNSKPDPKINKEEIAYVKAKLVFLK